ncbi:MAG: tungstate ABC transporter substrate-binding protein WtpA [Marinilabiliales bacterium]|nr:MAG: tungstate ABC transporter substrate-binding protein WtpA [Marinilabiliales bacterium]
MLRGAVYFRVLVLFCLVGGLHSCNGRPETLRIIHAGSLSVPVREAADSFGARNPGVRVLTEAWGSKAGARRISDLDVPCDIFISADYNVIDLFLIPGHASWNIPFAGNEMAIVYNTGSRYSDEINSENWYRVLLRDDVVYGRSDPDSDPCGVRSVFVTRLAELYYEEPGLSDRLLSRHRNMIRPKETELLALLEKNVLDYIFLYRSVAEQHRLQFVELPGELNLKDAGLNDWYARASVEVRGTRPGETMTETGEAMIYGITIPLKTRNSILAEEFVRFFLSGDGQAIMERNGQNSIVPAVSSTYGMVPESLRQFVKSE